MTPIRVMVVEDQIPILRTQVRLLESSPAVTVVGTACSGEEALEILPSARPEVILCDLGLPGIDGVRVTELVRTRAPGTEILIFTVFEEEEKVLAAVHAGAAGYLLKGIGLEKLEDAIREVHAGGTVIQPRLARLLLKHFGPARSEPVALQEPVPRLSPRELEILNLVAKGLTNVEAASVLGLSRSTIRTHLENIYEKLEVNNRVEAITEGLRQGWIET